MKNKTQWTEQRNPLAGSNMAETVELCNAVLAVVEDATENDNPLDISPFGISILLRAVRVTLTEEARKHVDECRSLRKKLNLD